VNQGCIKNLLRPRNLHRALQDATTNIYFILLYYLLYWPWLSNGSTHAHTHTHARTHTRTHTHTQPFYGPLEFCPELIGWAGNRKVIPERKTNLDLLEQQTVSGSGNSWAICKSSPWPRCITMPASHHSMAVLNLIQNSKKLKPVGNCFIYTKKFISSALPKQHKLIAVQKHRPDRVKHSTVDAQRGGITSALPSVNSSNTTIYAHMYTKTSCYSNGSDSLHHHWEQIVQWYLPGSVNM